ncbi:MAG TPA: phasin family protein [Candidatus Scybalocola faecipullorum]|nr:phasin family protein [Candidatus Scybalocola faecipullorum]
MDSLGDSLKKVLLAGIGAVATTAEKSKDVLDDLVKKGELTVEQGKVLNEELKHNIKKTMKEKVNVSVKPSTPEELDDLIDQMTPEQLDQLKERLAAAAEKAKAQEEETAQEPAGETPEDDA